MKKKEVMKVGPVTCLNCQVIVLPNSECSNKREGILLEESLNPIIINHDFCPDYQSLY